MNLQTSLFRLNLKTPHTVLRAVGFSLIALICVLFNSNAHAQPPREELETINRWIRLVKLGVPFELELVEYSRKERSPLVAVVTSQKSCLLVANENKAGWDAWDYFVGVTGLPSQDVMAFATLHEIGHCVNRLMQDSQWHAVSAGRQSELFADVYALAVLSKVFDSERFERLSKGVIKARRAQSGFFWSNTHNTADGISRFSEYLGHRSTVEEARKLGERVVDSGRTLAVNWFLESVTAMN